MGFMPWWIVKYGMFALLSYALYWMLEALEHVRFVLFSSTCTVRQTQAKHLKNKQTKMVFELAVIWNVK